MSVCVFKQYTAYEIRISDWITDVSSSVLVELCLDVGLGGVLLFGVTFLAVTGRAVAGAFRDESTETLWTLVFLTLFVLFSISESSIMRQNNLVWVMYVASIAAYGWRPAPPRTRPVARIVWPERGRHAPDGPGPRPAEPPPHDPPPPSSLHR